MVEFENDIAMILLSSKPIFADTMNCIQFYRLRHLNLGFCMQVQTGKVVDSIQLFKDRCLVLF